MRRVRVGSGDGTGAGGARRYEAGESEGGISSERLSKISGLLWRGELGARPSRSAGLTAVVKLCSHLTRIRKVRERVPLAPLI